MPKVIIFFIVLKKIQKISTSTDLYTAVVHVITENLITRNRTYIFRADFWTPMKYILWFLLFVYVSVYLLILDLRVVQNIVQRFMLRFSQHASRRQSYGELHPCCVNKITFLLPPAWSLSYTLFIPLAASHPAVTYFPFASSHAGLEAVHRCVDEE